MLTQLRKHLPKPVKRPLSFLRKKIIDNGYKKYLFLSMRRKHKKLIAQIKNKDRLRVVFLAIHKSVWKVDPVFKKMLADPYFDPIILVCPYTAFGDERMWEDMQLTFDYFTEKGYPTYSSYVKTEDRWMTLEEIMPDIVFFTNPHNLTRREYYEDAYLNYLSCYVPYHHEVGSYGGNESQYGQPFHVCAWRIYAAHAAALNLYQSTSPSKGENVKVVGFPAVESLYRKSIDNSFKDNWKKCDGRMRLIWAPHHIIDGQINQSNFLEYAEFFKDLAAKYHDKIIWTFKPHPTLKSKLYHQADWGKKRTDAYYQYWENSQYSQVELGDYEDLFLSSDAMIHDCGSFLAEYLYAKKPVLYLLSANHSGQFFNEFGTSALNACRIARSKIEIELFVHKLLSGEISEITEAHTNLYDKQINTYFKCELPSTRIISDIKFLQRGHAPK